jgi:hypothetical protein
MRIRLIEGLALLAAAASVALGGAVQAAESPEGELRFVAGAQGPAWVGQKVELYLELWTDGFSFGEQQFVLPEVPGDFLLQGDANTVKLTESRQGVTWQGLRYTLFLYPHRPGELRVPPFEVRFTARAGFGSEPSEFGFRTDALRIEARLPGGARPGELLVTTTEFSLQGSWNRSPPAEGPLQLQTGDALTLAVSRRAADVPGMVFEPLPRRGIEGLGEYPAAPVVSDRVNRGELVGTRNDSVTFICEQPGRYVIPEWRFSWWDPVREELSAKVIPELTLEVTANAAYGPEVAGEGGRLPWAIFIGVVAVGLALALGRHRPAVIRDAVGRLWDRTRRRRSRPRTRRGSLQPLNPRSSE